MGDSSEGIEEYIFFVDFENKRIKRAFYIARRSWRAESVRRR